jgi:hypothetical protein
MITTLVLVIEESKQKKLSACAKCHLARLAKKKNFVCNVNLVIFFGFFRYKTNRFLLLVSLVSHPPTDGCTTISIRQRLKETKKFHLLIACRFEK